jgi:CHC2 zinc finger
MQLKRNGSPDHFVCLCPLHQEKTPSFTLYPGNEFYCFGCTAKGDVIDLYAALDGLEPVEAARKLASGPLASSTPPYRVPLPNKAKEPSKPDLSFLRCGSRIELGQVAKLRKLDAAAVCVAQQTGILRFGRVAGFDSWVVSDTAGVCAEARRIDGRLFPAWRSLSERKAHTIRGSKKAWPVGIQPATKNRSCTGPIAMVEGGPDLLTAFHFALLQNRPDVLPVAMLGKGAGIRRFHPGAEQLLRSRRIRIFPHADSDGGGVQQALQWANHLAGLDCKVDFFVFNGLRKTDGSPIKDLNDCVELAPELADRLEELFP